MGEDHRRSPRGVRGRLSRNRHRARNTPRPARARRSPRSRLPFRPRSHGRASCAFRGLHPPEIRAFGLRNKSRTRRFASMSANVGDCPRRQWFPASGPPRDGTRCKPIEALGSSAHGRWVATASIRSHVDSDERSARGQSAPCEPPRCGVFISAASRWQADDFKNAIAPGGCDEGFLRVLWRPSSWSGRLIGSCTVK